MATLPVVAGEMQCRCLGAAVEAWSEPDASGRGQPLVDEVGELVCTQADAVDAALLLGTTAGDGRRYHASYFDMYPGVWRHGDWIRITPRGGAIIYGRSDATINRHGIRMGTAELYRAVETIPEVLDSLVVDLEYLGRESYMPLFVVLREGAALDAALTRALKSSIRTALSARHVPNEIFQVGAVPRTLSGKKMELPVKKLLMGTPAEEVFKTGAMATRRGRLVRRSRASPAAPRRRLGRDELTTRQLREVAAAVEDQRLRAFAQRAALDFADEDDVVAFFVAAAVEALEDRRRAVEEGAPRRAGVKGDAVEAVDACSRSARPARAGRRRGC